jgi:EmrB/QacA subfamily drug resistance transporter
VLAATVLGSGMASLDATVVNVALPRIGKALHTGFSGLQWTINAYTLTLAGFLLLGGALGDRFGRRRVFLAGVAGFGVASLACALAPTAATLIAARALEGAAAAVLTPSSLAILEASFDPADRGAAIGAWSGLGGVATAIGPLLGGWLVEVGSWRLVFLINLPVAVAVAVLAANHVPETSDPDAGKLDLGGAVLVAGGLAGLAWALTEGPARRWPVGVVAVLAVGVLAIVAFVAVERRSSHPLVPPRLFASREFSAMNAVTLAVYAALGGVFFFLPIELQRGLRFSPVAAGMSLLPVTAIMLLLSARTGRLATRIGPRIPLTFGPLLAAAGLALLVRVHPGMSYEAGVLPGMLVFGVGLALTVAPLTTAVLGAVADEHAGVASAINSDVARTAGLLAVAALPALAGVSTGDYLVPSRFTADFHTAVLISAAVCAAGGLLAAVTLGPARRERPAAAPVSFHCAVSVPPVATYEA